jgi:hypothetical protein
VSFTKHKFKLLYLHKAQTKIIWKLGVKEACEKKSHYVSIVNTS